MFQTPELSFMGFDYISATEIGKMKRNLELLFSTAAGTCPGDRNFGLDQSFESCPLDVAQNLFALEAIEKTEIYEKGAEILDISFGQAEDGNLIPYIIVGQKDAEDMEEDADGGETDG